MTGEAIFSASLGGGPPTNAPACKTAAHIALVDLSHHHSILGREEKTCHRENGRRNKCLHKVPTSRARHRAAAKSPPKLPSPLAAASVSLATPRCNVIISCRPRHKVGRCQFRVFETRYPCVQTRAARWRLDATVAGRPIHHGICRVRCQTRHATLDVLHI